MAGTTGGNARSTARYGLWLLTAATLIGLIYSLFNYFDAGNGIHGTEGALLVIISTALQLFGALLILFGVLRGGWKVLFEVLIFLDLLGTGVAAYFLEAMPLLGLTAVAFIGWLLQLAEQRMSLRTMETRS